MFIFVTFGALILSGCGSNPDNAGDETAPQSNEADKFKSGTESNDTTKGATPGNNDVKELQQAGKGTSLAPD